MIPLSLIPQVQPGTTSYLFCFRNCPLLLVVSATALSANSCHHFPGLLQKTPDQPPLLPVSAFCFIIHIIQQLASSLKLQTPILNLMSFPCLKAFVPATPSPNMAYKIAFKCFSTPYMASHLSLPYLHNFTGHGIHTLALVLSPTTQSVLHPFLSPKRVLLII